MDNFAIADNFSLLAKLIDIHGDNSFKAKSYAAAAFAIEKLPTPLETLPVEKISAIKGLGDSIAKKIVEQLRDGRLNELDAYVLKTPAGLFEMMRIKGLGPKKIATIWKELEIETIGELLYACNENRLLLYKGFGAKTQQNIKESIEFFLNNQGSYLFSQVEQFAADFTAKLTEDLKHTFLITGDFRRHAEVIYKLEWVTDIEEETLRNYLTKTDHDIEENPDYLYAKGPANIALHFYFAAAPEVVQKLFTTTGSTDFISAWTQQFPGTSNLIATNEEAFFSHHGLAYVPPFLRESAAIIEAGRTYTVTKVLQPADIKGIIHTHSNWSDGSHSIEEMAKAAIAKGYEYLVISDHSKSAFYANGLFPDRIKAQHDLIDEINEQLAPFKIFKSIESDILNDGSLDYSDEVLSTFDLVIASVHSNLKMTLDKAMARLLKVISHPFTNILGHVTGRLLLSRNGYPVDYLQIIEACAKYEVAIELNANPRRLDMDWRWIEEATKRGVLISVNPDAHATNTFDDVRYGVLAAQKGGLMAHQNVSSFNLAQFQQFVQRQQAKRKR